MAPGEPAATAPTVSEAPIQKIGSALRGWIAEDKKLAICREQFRKAQADLAAAEDSAGEAEKTVITTIGQAGNTLEKSGPNGLFRFVVDSAGQDVLVEVVGGEVRLLRAIKV